MSMNRQTKRMMAKQGDQKRPDARQKQPAPAQREKSGPREYFSEVKGEMRKVAWPTRPEVINSSMVVIIAVIFMGAAIFGLDYCAAKFVLFLFD